MAHDDTTASLRRAVDSGNWVVVNDLLDDKHVSEAVIEKSGLLHKLATSTDISLTLVEDIVDKICSHHVDLNSLDKEGMGAVHRLSMGSETEHDDVLFLLLNKGADINLTNIDNDTPLHVAAKYGNWRMMIALLRQAAKEDVANKDKRTVLHILADCLPSARTLSQKDVDNIFTLLRKTSLYIDATDCKGNTALHVAVRRGQSLIAEKLLTVGARADIVDAVGRTVLHIMATETHKYSSSLLMRTVKCGAKLKIIDCEGNTAFHLASIHENWHFLKMFTDTFVSETDDNPINYIFNNELRAAVEGRRWNVVKWIVKYSTDINTPDSQGRTLLQTLAQFNSDKNVDDTFSLLLEMGADITVQTREGENLLQLSVRHNNWLVAERLVRTGFGFCELDNEGQLGLLHRLLEQKAKQPTSLLILLCKNTANITVRTQSGDTLLQLAAKCGNIDVVKYLVCNSRHEILNDLDSEGFSILHRLVQHVYEELRDCSSREQPLISVVNLLLSKGVDPLCRSPSGDTVVHLAAKHDHWDIVKRLVELGLDVNEADSEGLCLLHRLVKTTKEDSRCLKCKARSAALSRLLQMLLSKGADPSIRTHSGDHVLHLAARRGNWTMVIHLLKQEESVNELDSEGFNILHRLVQDSLKKKKSSLLDIFINKGVDLNIASPHTVTALNMAVKAEKWIFARILVKRGADLNAKDPEGNTALHTSAKMNNWSFVAYLLNRGAHAKLPDSEGFTVLHRCLFAGRSTYGQQEDYKIAMNLILNSDVDMTVKDPEGNLAIHLAAMEENMDLVSKLINTPVNLNLKDSEGFTLLMRASAKSECVRSNNHTLSVIKHLLDSGVDPEARSPDGMTAFEMAVQCNNWPAILALLPRCEVKIGDNVSLTGAQYFHKLAMQTDNCDEKLRLFTKTLLARGLNINELNRHGDSPLTLAAKHQNWNYVVVLLQHGAEANVNVGNESLLHFTISKNRNIPHAVLRALLDVMQARGVDFNGQDCEGRTILFHDEMYFTNSYGQDPSSSLCRMLIDRGANPFVIGRYGHSLLRFSLDVNEDYKLNFLRLLVQTGVTTHQPALTEASETIASLRDSVFFMPSPTQAAFEYGDIKALKLLIESGASANRELFELSTRYEAEYEVRVETEVMTEMLNILNQAATQPRSLKSLCRLTVSHALGCNNREERATCLPIPQKLQQYILFRDILSRRTSP